MLSSSPVARRELSRLVRLGLLGHLVLARVLVTTIDFNATTLASTRVLDTVGLSVITSDDDTNVSRVGSRVGRGRGRRCRGTAARPGTALALALALS